MRGPREENLGAADATAPIMSALEVPVAHSPDSPAIGPYTILGVIGEGGMGVVYEARQEQPVQRTVALKVLRAEVSSPEVLARFQAERQALAVMDHPSIAKIFDAGVTEDGRSWFAMERVEGSPITEYCDRRRIGIRDRVRLFAEVCRAVQHAHQKGLIHRDLKPSNVLVSEVDGRPLPRIIDFGIAKATGGTEFDGTELTRDDQVVGTPAYMSPEQLDGSADVDTRSDVYSLGVLLYQLLVGALPFRSSAYRGWAAVVGALHRETPTPAKRLGELDADTASRAAEARGTTIPDLRHALHGDLTFIVARAMEKDRDRRYETATGLALDLERYLTHQPVRARGPNRWYTLRKFVRRNRMGVAFAATVVVGLVAFAVTTAVQAARIQARQEQGEALIDFMLSDLRGKLEPLGRLDVLDAVGDQAVEYFASLPASEYTDDELASRSRALYQIGSVRLNEGRSDEAVPAFQESLRLARLLSGRAPDDPQRLFDLSQSHFWVGYADWLAGNLEEAELQLQAYLDIAGRLVELEPDNLDYRMELGYAQSNLGSIREARGDLTGAQDAFEATLSIQAQLSAGDPDNVAWMGELAESHNKLAVVLRKLGRYGEARDLHAEELRLKRQLLEVDPEQAYWRSRLAQGLGFAGESALQTGDEAEGLRLFRERLHMLDSLTAFDPANARWRRSAVVAAKDLARMLSVAGAPSDALPLLNRAEAMVREILVADSTGVANRSDLASVLTVRAMTLVRLGDTEAAVGAARQAVTLLPVGGEGVAPARRRAEALLELGRALEAGGDAAAARESWQEALGALAAILDGPAVAEVRPLRAELLLLLDRPEGEARFRELIASGYREPTLLRVAKDRGIEP